MTQLASPSRPVERDSDEAAMTHIRLSAPRYGPRRQASKTYSRRHNYKYASFFSSVRDAVIPFAVRFADAGTQACQLFRRPPTCCARGNSAFPLPAKTAARRPHRSIQLVETKRLVQTPTSGDAPFRSYSTMKSRPQRVDGSAENAHTGCWTDTRAVGVRGSDSQRVGCVCALEL
jgi:hypothetical protein